MNPADIPCGLFGKIPQQADYVSHHLPASFTDYWHQWLQSAMSVSHEQLGERWLDHFLTSPVWHFAISPGVFGPEAAMGVMIPSCDEVGRYLPLVVAHAHPAHQPWSAYLFAKDWYTDARAVALAALHESVGYMELIERLEGLAPPAPPAIPAFQTHHASHGAGKGFVIASDTDTTSQAFTAGLLEHTYARLLGNYSVWWTDGSAQVEPCTLISAALPEAGQYAAMLDGQWPRWHWSIEQQLIPGHHEAAASAAV